MSIATDAISALGPATGEIWDPPRIDQVLEVQRQATRVYHEDFESGYVAGNLNNQDGWGLNPGTVGNGRLFIDAGSKLGGTTSVQYDQGAGAAPSDRVLYVHAIPEVRALGDDTVAAGYGIRCSFHFDDTRFSATGVTNASGDLWVVDRSGDALTDPAEWSISILRNGSVLLYDQAGASTSIASAGTVTNGDHQLRIEINQGLAIQVFLDGTSIYGPTVGDYDAGSIMDGIVLGVSANSDTPLTDFFGFDGIVVEIPTVAPTLTNVLYDGDVTLGVRVGGDELSYQVGASTAFVNGNPTVDLESSSDNVNWDSDKLFPLAGVAGGLAAVQGVPLKNARYVRFAATLPQDYDNAGVQVVTNP